jgi:hypothetical protein
MGGHDAIRSVTRFASRRATIIRFAARRVPRGCVGRRDGTGGETRVRGGWNRVARVPWQRRHFPDGQNAAPGHDHT